MAQGGRGAGTVEDVCTQGVTEWRSGCLERLIRAERNRGDRNRGGMVLG